MSGTAGGGLAYRRRAFVPFHHFTRFDADHHHIVRRHHRVIDAGRLDHKHAFIAVNGADVAPGQGDQIMFRQRQVGFEHLAFELF
jgi:hypothetical protein